MTETLYQTLKSDIFFFTGEVLYHKQHSVRKCVCIQFYTSVCPFSGSTIFFTAALWAVHKVTTCSRYNSIGYLHWLRPNRVWTPIRIPNPMTPLYYAEHVHITQTQTPTPYFSTGQESESESAFGNVNVPLLTEMMGMNIPSMTSQVLLMLESL